MIKSHIWKTSWTNEIAKISISNLPFETKLLGLMRLPKPQYTTYLSKQINPQLHTLSEKHEKTVKAIQKIS